MRSTLAILATSLTVALGLNNGLGRTPQVSSISRFYYEINLLIPYIKRKESSTPLN